MPRLVTSIPKYRKHKGSGQAMVTVNGRDHYLGPHGTKAIKLEYDRIINQWIVSSRNPNLGLTSKQFGESTLSDLMNSYRKWAVKYYRHPDGKLMGSKLHCRLKRVKCLHTPNTPCRLTEFDTS